MYRSKSNLLPISYFVKNSQWFHLKWLHKQVTVAYGAPSARCSKTVILDAFSRYKVSSNPLEISSKVLKRYCFLLAFRWLQNKWIEWPWHSVFSPMRLEFCSEAWILYKSLFSTTAANREDRQRHNTIQFSVYLCLSVCLLPMWWIKIYIINQSSKIREKKRKRTIQFITSTQRAQ